MDRDCYRVVADCGVFVEIAWPHIAPKIPQTMISKWRQFFLVFTFDQHNLPKSCRIKSDLNLLQAALTPKQVLSRTMFSQKCKRADPQGRYVVQI